MAFVCRSLGAAHLLCCELSACHPSYSTGSMPSSSHTLSPAVRYLVDSHGIDVTQLQPTGPKNRLLKWDVMQFLSNKMPTATTTAPKAEKVITDHNRSKSFTDIPLTNMRKTIAKRLTLSKSTIPYSYAVVDCRMDNALRLRDALLKERDLKVSVNDLVVKATALALQKIPECNASWINNCVEVHTNIDVSIAVATEGGLITPILKNADVLKISEISSQIRVLAKKAREGKLQPHEYQGGTFSVSNLGMFGISQFSAIINPPQAAIIAIGGVRSIPCIEDTTSSMMTATLSHDCRVIDNELAARWLSVFRNLLESPSILDF